MVFDTTISMIGYMIDADEEQGITVTMTVGMPLPISPGPGQPPLLLPMGQMRYPMAHQDAINFANSIIKKAEELPEEPKKPDLLITDKMPNLDVNEIDRKLRG